MSCFLLCSDIQGLLYVLLPLMLREAVLCRDGGHVCLSCSRLCLVFIKEELADMADAQRLRPRVAEEVPLEEEALRAAFRRLHQRRVVGKLVIRMPDREGD